MTLSHEVLLAAVDDLLTRGRSREAVAQWAMQATDAADANTLDYVPPSAEEELWDAALFLSFIDAKTSPDTYLYDDDDLVDLRQHRLLLATSAVRPSG